MPGSIRFRATQRRALCDGNAPYVRQEVPLIGTPTQSSACA
jgi:hypothetical protein